MMLSCVRDHKGESYVSNLSNTVEILFSQCIINWKAVGFRRGSSVGKGFWYSVARTKR